MPNTNSNPGAIVSSANNGAENNALSGGGAGGVIGLGNNTNKMSGGGAKRNQLTGPCYLKMLVNNLVAGSIIGKNGAVINSILNQTGCTVKLSPSNAFFPNTTDRVVVMSGKLEQINSAMLIILDKVKEVASQYAYEPNCGNQLSRLSCKIVVPKSAVSAIIGKGGQQVRDLQASTEARIHISSREEDLDERTVTISGSAEAMQNAALAVASSIQNTSNLKDHMYLVYNNKGNNLIMNQLGGGGSIGGSNIPLTAGGYITHQYGGAFNSDSVQYGGGAVLGHQGGAYGGVLVGGGSMMRGAAAGQCDILNMQCEITMQIPDNYVGPVIGKNGSSLADIIQNTGARVQISQKGDLVPETNDRKVVISGAVIAVHQAHIMLLQRLDNFQNHAHNNNNINMNNNVQHNIGGGGSMGMVHNNTQNVNMQRGSGGVQMAHNSLQQYASGGY